MDSAKRLLFTKWFFAHLPRNMAPLFTSKNPVYELTMEAEMLLKRKDSQGEMSIYIVCLGDMEDDKLFPVYIGKASSLYKRWKDGHLRGLRKAANEEGESSYNNWVDLFEKMDEKINIVCVNQRDILFSPIPQFPTTIGSIEYQLISLATDAFPNYLLNQEGVAR